MSPTFIGPTRDEWTFADGVSLNPSARLFWSHYGLQPRGRTALKTSGTWALVDTPTLFQINDADTIIDTFGQKVPGVLMGGHEHPVSATVEAELVADGLGAYVTP